MITKGALVIIKHGDPDMANAMANSIRAPAIKAEEIKPPKPEAKYYFAKMRDEKAIMRKIRRAQRKYGYNWIPSNKRVKAVREALALIEYGFATLLDAVIPGKHRR